MAIEVDHEVKKALIAELRPYMDAEVWEQGATSGYFFKKSVEDLRESLTKYKADAAIAADRRQRAREAAWTNLLLAKRNGKTLANVQSNKSPIMSLLLSHVSSIGDIPDLHKWLLCLPAHTLDSFAWVEAPVERTRENFLAHVRANSLSECEANWQAFREGRNVTIPASEEEQIDRRPWDFPGTVQYKRWLSDPARLPSEIALAARREREAAQAAGPTVTVYERQGKRDVPTQVPQATLETASAAQRDSFKQQAGRTFEPIPLHVNFKAIKAMDHGQLKALVRRHGEAAVTQRVNDPSFR